MSEETPTEEMTAAGAGADDAKDAHTPATSSQGGVTGAGDKDESVPLYRSSRMATAAAAAGATAARAKDATGSAATSAKNAVKAKLQHADQVVSERSGATAGVEVARPSELSAVASQAPVRRTRKARLRLSRVDPWSVMKTTFMFAIAGGIVLFVAVWVLWGVIGASGVFESVNKAVNDLVASPDAENSFRLEDWVNTNKVLGFTALVGAINVVLFTALTTLFSFLYNLAATVLGGLEVTLAED